MRNPLTIAQIGRTDFISSLTIRKGLRSVHDGPWEILSVGQKANDIKVVLGDEVVPADGETLDWVGT